MAREEGAKEMSEEEQLPEVRWRKVVMSESLKGRRSEEMTQRILPLHGGRKYLLSPRGVMVTEVPQIKRFLEKRRMEGEKKLILVSVGEERIGGA